MRLGISRAAGIKAVYIGLAFVTATNNKIFLRYIFIFFIIFIGWLCSRLHNFDPWDVLGINLVFVDIVD